MEEKLNNCILLRSNISSIKWLERLDKKIPILKSCNHCWSMEICQLFIKNKLNEVINPKKD